MFRQRRDLPAFRRSEELLIPAVYQQPDLVPDHHSGFSNNGRAVGSVFDNGSASELADFGARALALELSPCTVNPACRTRANKSLKLAFWGFWLRKNMRFLHYTWRGQRCSRA